MRSVQFSIYALTEESLWMVHILCLVEYTYMSAYIQ